MNQLPKFDNPVKCCYIYLYSTSRFSEIKKLTFLHFLFFESYKNVSFPSQQKHQLLIQKHLHKMALCLKSFLHRIRLLTVFRIQS